MLEETGGDFLFISVRIRQPFPCHWTALANSTFRPQYSDLRRILAEFAIKHGAVLRPSCEASSVKADAERPSVTLATGEVLTADVVIGADGCLLTPYRTRRAIVEATGQADVEQPAGFQLFK